MKTKTGFMEIKCSVCDNILGWINPRKKRTHKFVCVSCGKENIVEVE
jgi:predicted RNA-binding Zn-ribbon protein involved in translation (DUF1610 family)